MTREIKFRAWSNETKTMISWESIKELKNLQKLMSLHFVALMQFTWLYDKNNQPIYEWDIIKISWYVDWYMPVQSVSYWMWMFYVVDSWWWNHCIYNLWTESNVEIIWNIYEHPHLLTNDQWN